MFERNLLVEVQRRRVPVFLVLVVRPGGNTSDGRGGPAVRLRAEPPEHVAEHETGQQEGHAHRTARQHFRFGR